MDIESAILGGAGAFAHFLNQRLMEVCVQTVNTRFALPFISKLPTERLPTHQRNLTDSRTRIGVLLEYSFGLALQGEMEANGLSGYRISYVVANRYPDLYIRDASSEPLIRLEVKALELVSEEKSANFDALVRDVNPERDVLCVLLWEWKTADLAGMPIDFPEVKCGFAFEAYPIAIARDLGWLSQRPAGLTKAIDLAGPVVGNETSLRKEEHNMGKLMRILGGGEVQALPEELATHPGVEAYRLFKTFTVTAGLKHNAARLFAEVGIIPREESDFQHSKEMLTVARGRNPDGAAEVIVAAAGRISLSLLVPYQNKLRSENVDKAIIIVFNEKFFWSVYAYDGGRLRKVDSGRKFEAGVARLKEIYASLASPS